MLLCCKGLGFGIISMKQKLQIPQKTPEPSSFQVVSIPFIGISLSFKTYISVGFFLGRVVQSADKIFGHIPNVKWEDEQLSLLPQVDAFVVQENRMRAEGFVPYKNKWEQRDAAVTLRD